MTTAYAQESDFVFPSPSSANGGFDILLPSEEEATESPPVTQEITQNEIKNENQSYDILLQGGEEESEKPENTEENQILLENTEPEQPKISSSEPLSRNYYDIYNISPIMPLSESGSDPYAYVNGNQGTITVVSDKLLNNILYYENGEVASNIHIAKWIKGDPAALEYPAYCKNPEYHGVAQHPDKKYGIKPVGTLTDKHKEILGIMRSGYPFHSPQELGLQDVDEAYYATLGAIQTSLIDGSLEKWSIRSGNEERNTRILNALKSIYTNGVQNPYSPPPIVVKLVPTTGSEEATEEEEWVTNTYEFQTDYPINTWKLNFLSSENFNAMVQSGEIEVYVGGTKANLQQNINGVWDDVDGFSVPAGQSVTVKFKKSIADATGLNVNLYGSISDVDFQDCLSYVGDAVEGGWQGYCYNTVPYATDTAIFSYQKTGQPDTPDIPSPSGNGSLIIQKLDWRNKKNIADAVFHIQGLSDNCKWINIAVKASNGAVLPELGGGASISVADGKISLSKIPGGFYEITEISAPPNYDVAVGQNSQTVEVKEEESDVAGAAQVTFENKPYGSLTITKTDADTGKKLNGVFFHVVNAAGGIEQTVETGTDGTATIENLPQGNYEITEIGTREDYIVNTTPETVGVQWGQETTITITNKAKPYIEILKIDSETSQPISGVAFQITNKNTQQSFSATTDGEGKIKLTSVEEGWYDVQEVTPASGYIADTEIHQVYAESGKPGKITIKNTKKSRIVIQKTDSKNNPLQGVSFNIYNFGGTTPIPNSPVTTNEQGIAELENLNPGHYQVQEVSPPSGYMIDTKKYDLIVEEGENNTTSLKIVNKKLPSLTIRKVDTAQNDKGLAGAVFEVKETDGQALAGSPYTTGADGSFKIENIDLDSQPIKKLTITEIQPPPGYHLSNPSVQYATLEPDKDVVVTFSDSKLPTLTIEKVDSKTKEKLAKAVFSVEKLEQPDKGMITGSPFTTDENGKITLPNQKPGSYKITEISAPPNYILDTEERIITLKEGEDFTARFENTKKPTLTVHKVDSITKDPLAGAEFLVSKAQNGSLNGGVIEVGKYYSDANGKFVLECVDSGWYRILETHPASGYREEKNYYQDVFLQAGVDKEITFENTPKNAIIIRKVDSDTGEALPNIRFEVRYLSGATGTEGTVIGVYTTSENGTAVVAGLKPGVYSVAELKADSDHILDDTIQTVTLADDNAVVTVEFGNAPKGGLLIKKMDAVTKEPLDNAIFMITDVKGNVVGEGNGEFRTDESGVIYIP